MKETYVAYLSVGEEIQDFFKVKQAIIKEDSRKKQYFDLVLSDYTGEINAKKWDVSEEEAEQLNLIQPPAVIKIKAQVTEFNGVRQLKILKLRPCQPEDDLDMNDFIKAAPEKPQDMLDYILGVIDKMQDRELAALCNAVIEEKHDKLMYYPAATKNHHAELGGLLYHTKRMLENAVSVCKIYGFLNKDLLCCGVILHDMEKTNEIVAETDGTAQVYSMEGQMLGHLVQGVKMVERIGTELGIGQEKKIMVEHMLLSHHYEPEYGSPKKPMFAEAEMLHYLDVMDARMWDLEDVLVSVSAGEFSEMIKKLDGRRIYKPSWTEK